MSRPIPPGSAGSAAARLAALEDAVDLARLAPSIHNTQPWTFVLQDDTLAVRVDRGRHLHAIDPAGRALVQSVGAALLNARVALAADGWAAEVTRLPRPQDPDLLAEVRAVTGPPDGDLAVLAALPRKRHTNRRQFTADRVPDDVLRHLTELAAREHTDLVPVLREESRALVGRLTQDADRAQNADPAYRAELRRWTTRDTASGDGVPSSAVPHVDGRQQDAVPLRDFDTQGTGALPAETGSGTDQTLVLLATATDDSAAWLRSGEALERILLELTRLGWVASPVTQAIEVPVTRTRLRSALTWEAHPQMLLRIGRAVPTAPTPRRPRADVVRGSARPGEPVPVTPQSAWDEARGRSTARDEDGDHPRRPVSDGRGGTVWIR